MREAIALVRREREDAGLDPNSISVGAYVNAVAHPDIEVARELARGSTATFAHFSGMDGAPSNATADAAVYKSLGTDYDMAGHASAGSAHAAALPDDFIDRFAVAGPADYCVDRLSELIEAGAERLVLVPGSRDADRNELLASMARLATDVLPQLR
jgi:5,10-methylenetetrahydromethanopterin reductase